MDWNFLIGSIGSTNDMPIGFHTYLPTHHNIVDDTRIRYFNG